MIYNYAVQLVARRLQTQMYFLDLFERNHCMLINIVLNAAGKSFVSEMKNHPVRM